MWLLMRSNDYTFIEKRLPQNGTSPKLTVTVVIPFYAGLEFLDRTLASLSAQTYPRELMDVIVVEDGSRQSTKPLVDSYSSFFRIKSYSIPRNGFQAATCRNVGVRESRSDVILSLDFDIILTPRAVSGHMRWFHTSEHAATIGLRRFVDATCISAEDVKYRIDQVVALPDIRSVSNTDTESLVDKRIPELEQLKSHPYPFNCFHGCNIAYRRDDALAAGLWNEEFNGFFGYEDIEFGYRLYSKGIYLIYEPAALGLHQENTFVDSTQRKVGLHVNRQRLYALIPGLADYRERVNHFDYSGPVNSVLPHTWWRPL